MKYIQNLKFPAEKIIDFPDAIVHELLFFLNTTDELMNKQKETLKSQLAKLFPEVEAKPLFEPLLMQSRGGQKDYSRMDIPMLGSRVAAVSSPAEVMLGKHVHTYTHTRWRTKKY